MNTLNDSLKNEKIFNMYNILLQKLLKALFFFTWNTFYDLLLNENKYFIQIKRSTIFTKLNSGIFCIKYNAHILYQILYTYFSNKCTQVTITVISYLNFCWKLNQISQFLLNLVFLSSNEHCIKKKIFKCLSNYFVCDQIHNIECCKFGHT